METSDPVEPVAADAPVPSVPRLRNVRRIPHLPGLLSLDILRRRDPVKARLIEEGHRQQVREQFEAYARKSTTSTTTTTPAVPASKKDPNP